MKYRNKKTGTVIDIESRLSGELWEEVKLSPKAPKKKAGVKDGDVRNDRRH